LPFFATLELIKSGLFQPENLNNHSQATALFSKKVDALHKIKHPTPVWEVVNTGIATSHLTLFWFMVFNELTVITN